MSIVVVARVFPGPDQLASVIEAITAAIPSVHAEDGCELYSLNEDPEAGELVMIEKWADRGALDAHLASEPFKAMSAVLSPLCARRAEITILTPHPAGTAEQGQI